MEDEDESFDDASVEELKRNVPLDPKLGTVRNQEKAGT